MKLRELRLPGSFEISLSTFHDARGSFVKTYAFSAFHRNGLETGFTETFYTVSEANVLRGMHFQGPPRDYAKLVYCVAGSVLDVALDLRVGSPTYGQFEAVKLDSRNGNALYLASGLAHGFAVLEAPAVMAYHVTSEHAPGADKGIRWDSFGARWPGGSPILSERDANLPPFEQFASPFVYREAAVSLR